MSEQIGTVLEAIRLEQETHRAEHQAMMARIEGLDQANRAEHKAMMTQLSGLGRELVKLGVEFEQHERHEGLCRRHPWTDPEERGSGAVRRGLGLPADQAGGAGVKPRSPDARDGVECGVLLQPSAWSRPW